MDRSPAHHHLQFTRILVMSVISISSNLADFPSNPHRIAKAGKDFSAPSGDRHAGNVTGPEQDFATLLQDAPQLQSALLGGQSALAVTAFGSLSTALQSGDLTSARAAMASFQRCAGDHYRRHDGPAPAPIPASSTTGDGGIAGNQAGEISTSATT